MELFWFSPLESGRSLILWGVFLGFVLAILYLMLIRAKSARVLKTLLEKEAFDAASAVPLSRKTPDRGALAGVVKSAGNGEEKTWFIPPEKREKAEYLARLRAFKWYLPLLAILALYAAMLAVHAVLPLLLDR